MQYLHEVVLGSGETVCLMSYRQPLYAIVKNAVVNIDEWCLDGSHPGWLWIRVQQQIGVGAPGQRGPKPNMLTIPAAKVFTKKSLAYASVAAKMQGCGKEHHLLEVIAAMAERNQRERQNKLLAAEEESHKKEQEKLQKQRDRRKAQKSLGLST